MKRIDQKVQEIEKKDKQNRIIYIAFVALILAFMAIVLYYQDQIAKKDQAITEEQVKNSELYKDLEEKKNEIETQKNQLEASLRPEEYWDFIKDENTNEAYIDYLTNVWGIQRTHIDEAMNNLVNTASGEEGWLYIGKIVNDNYTQPDDGQIVKVVWRKDHENNLISQSEPRVNDVVQLVRTRNRNIRSTANPNVSPKSEGWRPGTKAFVADKTMNGIEVWIKIKYY